MKKKGLILAVLMIVLGAFALMALQQTKEKEEAVEQIIDKRHHIDQIVVKKQGKVVRTLKDQSAQTYAEPTPLAKIEHLERSTKKKFEKTPIYSISYYVSGETLYEVDVVALKKGEALTTEENDYSFTLNGREMMLVWQPYEERLSQHDVTKQLLETIH